MTEKNKTVKKNLIRIAVIIVFCIAVASIIKNVFLREDTAVHIPLVKTLTVSEEYDISQYTYPGEVSSKYESQLAFMVGGKISKQYVEVGDFVKAGQILLQINPQDLSEAANINAAAVEAAQSKYDLAKLTLDRMTELYNGGGISKAEYDNAENAYQLAAASLSQAQASYSQSLNQLEYCQLRADKSGTIAEINVEEGQVIAAGQKVISIVQNDELEININIPESKIKEINIGDKVFVKFWALDDTIIPGEISEISPMADPATRTYAVKVSLSDKNDSVKIGMSATVSLNSENEDKDKGIYLPLTAIYQTGDAPQVWVIENNIAHLRIVETGNFSGNQVEIKKGLKKGEIVATAGVNKLSEDQTVRLEGDIK